MEDVLLLVLQDTIRPLMLNTTELSVQPVMLLVSPVVISALIIVLHAGESSLPLSDTSIWQQILVESVLVSLNAPTVSPKDCGQEFVTQVDAHNLTVPLNSRELTKLVGTVMPTVKPATKALLTE